MPNCSKVSRKKKKWQMNYFNISKIYNAFWIHIVLSWPETRDILFQGNAYRKLKQIETSFEAEKATTCKLSKVGYKSIFGNVMDKKVCNSKSVAKI